MDFCLQNMAASDKDISLAYKVDLMGFQQQK